MGVTFTDFYNASQARSIATGGGAPLGVVLAEINFIKTQIDTLAPTGVLSVTITNATIMTSVALYYEAWVDQTTFQDDAHNVARERMNAVVSYFTRLGYAIRRQQDGTNNRISWVISF